MSKSEASIWLGRFCGRPKSSQPGGRADGLPLLPGGQAGLAELGLEAIRAVSEPACPAPRWLPLLAARMGRRFVSAPAMGRRRPAGTARLGAVAGGAQPVCHRAPDPAARLIRQDGPRREGMGRAAGAGRPRLRQELNRTRQSFVYCRRFVHFAIGNRPPAGGTFGLTEARQYIKTARRRRAP